MYHGDIRLGDTIDIKFTTVNTSGVPTTLAGTPVVSAYVGNGTTEITAGVTLTADFDGRTGLNNVRVVASGGNGFATATNVQLVITTGTVGGSSVVGYFVASFSIEARSALIPTAAGRTFDVSAGGEGGIDWANIGAPTTTQTLSGTTVGTATAVTTLNALAANVITATSIAADAINDSKVASDVTIASVTGAVGSVATGGITSGSFAAGAINAAAIAASAIGASELATDALTAIQSGLATAASLTTALSDLDDIQTRLPAALVGGRMSSNVGAIDNEAAAATKLRRGVKGNVLGTVGAASSTTSIVTSSLDAAAVTTDQFKGRILTFDDTTTTAALRDQGTDITASTAGGVLTVTALTTAPASGDTFTIT